MLRGGIYILFLPEGGNEVEAVHTDESMIRQPETGDLTCRARKESVRSITDVKTQDLFTVSTSHREECGEGRSRSGERRDDRHSSDSMP